MSVAAVAAVLMLPVSAQAAVAQMSFVTSYPCDIEGCDGFSYTASPAERNDATITFLPDVVISNPFAMGPPVGCDCIETQEILVHDAATTITAGTGCTSLGPDTALCNDTGLSGSLAHYSVALGSGGNDRLVVRGSPPYGACGLSGGCVNTVTSGPGNDYIDVQDGAPETVDCGGGNDTLIADPQDTPTNCSQVITAPQPLVGATVTVLGQAFHIEVPPGS